MKQLALETAALEASQRGLLEAISLAVSNVVIMTKQRRDHGAYCISGVLVIFSHSTYVHVIANTG